MSIRMHWIHTLDGITGFVIRTSISKTQAAGPDTSNNPICFANSPVYGYIPEYTELVIQIFKKVYLQSIYVVFERHLLATCRQKGQNVHQFLQKPKSLAEDWDFRISCRTAEHKRIYTGRPNLWPAVFNNPSFFAQHELSLDEAYERARSFELAHKQSQSYTNNQSLSWSSTPSSSYTLSQSPLFPEHLAAAGLTCYFYG
ncbi:hypothetical protein FGIG_00406 [Fasciola gigantica]|uniref:Uncharacterized protein n=1 Tax=Fasciola gigantica TaxID=46835 RepID=A0A504Z0I8_FASGI|nr:hypothetical protein FGIG_00406 [Fasciola gigantica]